jgi:hypothetical protein
MAIVTTDKWIEANYKETQLKDMRVGQRVKISVDAFGDREFIMEKLMSSGKFKMGTFDGWAEDPYQPSFKGPALRNKSEDEKYDAKFPDHPLSRCRKTLANVIATIKIDEAVSKSAPFQGSR